MFEELKVRGLDPLMMLMEAFRNDPRDSKVDLGVGVYKDDDGNVPIMSAVKAAEARILQTERTKNYVGVAGDPELTARAPKLLLGDGSDVLAAGRAVCAQTPGGNGALKLGCDLINRVRPGNRIWVSTPTWGNHHPTGEDAGLTVASYPYFRAEDRSLDFAGMMAHLAIHAAPGEAILVHACCHNPTGVDLRLEHWQVLTDFVFDRGMLPFVDCAYQGFGHGLEEDVAGLRYMAERVPEMLIASSFSKIFGIYRERCGALTAIAKTSQEGDVALQALKTVVRSNYSMPPSHGARIVSTIFADEDLTAEWNRELTTMRTRIGTMRKTLRTKLEERQVSEDMSFLTEQVGMFSYTGFTPDMVNHLRDDFGVYMAGDGRINIAGLGTGNIDAVADSFAAVLRRYVPA